MIKDYLEQVFWIQDQIKLLHWQTQSGFHHKTLDKFHKKISEKLDELVEVSIGCNIHGSLEVSDGLFKLENYLDLNDLVNKISEILLNFRTQFESLKYYALISIVDDLSAITLQYKFLLCKLN